MSSGSLSSSATQSAWQGNSGQPGLIPQASQDAYQTYETNWEALCQTQGLIENLLVLGRVDLLPSAMLMLSALSATNLQTLQAQVDAESVSSAGGTEFG